MTNKCIHLFWSIDQKSPAIKMAIKMTRSPQSRDSHFIDNSWRERGRSSSADNDRTSAWKEILRFPRFFHEVIDFREAAELLLSSSRRILRESGRYHIFRATWPSPIHYSLSRGDIKEMHYLYQDCWPFLLRGIPLTGASFRLTNTEWYVWNTLSILDNSISWNALSILGNSISRDSR